MEKNNESQPNGFATAPLMPCGHSGCPELVRGGGYCDKHRKEYKRTRRALRPERVESKEYHNLYYTKRWRTMRAEQLIAEPFCRECGRHGVRQRATDVDHIKAHRGDLKLFYDKSNLQSLCHECHSRKTMAERATLPPYRKDIR